MRARPIALSARSRRSSRSPTGAVCPVVKIRWTTSRTAPTRSASWSGAGTRYGMRAAAIFFLARVIRAAMVASGTRNARATSAVDRPQTSRSVSATWASRDSAGWQQVKTSRRRSSSGPGACSGVTSSGSARRSTACRRSASRARLRAIVVSHAPGRSGMPVRGQVTSAWAYASWVHSSARSRSRVRRAVAASTRAHSRRWASATAAATSVVIRGYPPGGSRRRCGPRRPRAAGRRARSPGRGRRPRSGSSRRAPPWSPGTARRWW